MRKPPTTELQTPPPVSPVSEPHIVASVREYELITPLCGGGVEPGYADPVTVVRGTEVRGHLRFWWRATRGGRFDGNLGAMKESEDKLWGAPSTERSPRPSQVQIHVHVPNNQRGQKFVERDDHGNIARDRRGNVIEVYDIKSRYGYGAFPLRDKRGAIILDGVRFKLSVRYPRAEAAEVEAALWAWETFGGIGARTRRGFGALRLVSVDGRNPPLPNANIKEVRALLKQQATLHVFDGSWPPDVPCLPQPGVNLTFTGPETTTQHVKAPIKVWEKLLRKLKDFRQDRNPGTNKPGRSRWPEPDAIRRLTRKRSSRHGSVHFSFDVFPRADFGLPIIFEFNPTDVAANDPGKTTLEGKEENQTRLASPLILRPLACAANKAVGIAIILDAPRIPLGGLVLRGAPGDPTVNSGLATLSKTELDSITPLKGDDDVLQAFLDFLIK